MEMRDIYQFLNVLNYGKDKALTVKQLHTQISNCLSLPYFARKCRLLAHECRLKGHWVIGDDSGYYKALTKNEWDNYKNKRFASIRDELEALASCDKISIKDLIYNVYAVSLEDNNYNLAL